MHWKGSHHEHGKHLNLKLAQHVSLERMEMFRQSSQMQLYNGDDCFNFDTRLQELSKLLLLTLCQLSLSAAMANFNLIIRNSFPIYF